MMTMWKKTIFIIALCLWSVVLALTTGEIFLRLSDYYRCSLNQAFPAIFVDSPAYNHKLRRNSRFRHCSYHGDYVVNYTINANGERMVPKSQVDAVSKQPIILVYGDSFTFGLGVNDEETFAAQLQNKHSVRQAYVVANKGVPGYTIDQEFMALKGHLRAPNDSPQPICAVVLQVFTYNDLQELDNHVTGADGAGIRDRLYHVDDTFRLNAKPTRINILKRASRKLFVYRFLVEDFNLNMRRLKRWFGVGPPEKRRSKEEIRREHLRWVQKHGALIERYKKTARKFFALAEKHQIPVIVVFERGANRALNDVLERFFKAQPNVKLLDTAQYLSKEHYLPKDLHYSADGHAEIAKRLSTMIDCQAGRPNRQQLQISINDDLFI